MSLKARRKAGMPIGTSGKPVRPYTNASEAINNVMLQTKESYLRDKKKPETAKLSKLEFTKHVFEEVHRKQQEELTLAVIGLNDKYELSKMAAYLAVPRTSVSIDDAISKKTITVADADMSQTKEFQDLSVELCKVLVSKRGYKEEIARAVEEGALMLLNSPSAIQQQPTLDQKKAIKFEVASRSAKHGRVVCTVNVRHVSCGCPSFKADRVCKHSVAVAEKNGLLREHLQFICKGSARKGASHTPLAEAYVNKGVAGKKGSTNKHHYRPSQSTSGAMGPTNNSEVKSTNSQSENRVYSEIHHNDNPFILRILTKEANICKGCGNNFCHRQRIVPNDLVFEHKERYYFPLNGDWKKSRQQTRKQATITMQTPRASCRDIRISLKST
ncbi:hypothetical protein OS493_029024 [Desmophyllum pertusum]|uniref:SWIM-type domain-containing protein n=1 Tax=Desmophyllum pertusum TaxID=174260 RepID=A0A9W9YK31_9CNID|nr:hypothetical protein OS493_029024 [Desmophyllum pertusum]